MAKWLELLKVLYVLLLKGRTIKVGGTNITLPEKGNEIPGTGEQR